MSTRQMIRIVEATLDDAPMDCEDHDRVHVWAVVPSWSYRRAFLLQGTPFMAAAGFTNPELYTETKVYGLVGNRFFAEIDLPVSEVEAAERIEVRKVEPAPDASFGPPPDFTLASPEPYRRDEREAYTKRLLDDVWLKGNIQRQRAYVHDPLYHHDIKVVLSVLIALDESMARTGLSPDRRDEILRLTFAGGPFGILVFPPDVREAIVRMERDPFQRMRRTP